MDPTSERNTVISTLRAAADRLAPALHSSLIPREGVSFGYAIRGARDAMGIAAVEGGIQKGADGKTATAGPCRFGTDEPVVRIILTVLKFDSSLRSAASLQYSAKVAGIFSDDLFLECASVDTSSRNPGISTMDWDIASCCKKGVPDVIFRMEAGADASRIILFGEGPADVLNNIIICSNRI